MELYYRIGTAGEQGLFDAERESYTGVGVGAHVAAIGRTWVSGLLFRLGKPYFVDPVTYAFAQDPKIVRRADELRRSYDGVAEEYGGVVRQYAGKRALRPSDLKTQAAAEDLVAQVIGFQEKVFSRPGAAQASLLEYLAELGETVPGPSSPTVLIPPYFYAGSADDPWHVVNIRLAEIALGQVERERVAPVVCVSEHGISSGKAVDRLVSDYSRFSTVFVWVSGLNEQKATQSQLLNYSSLVRGLAERGTKPRAFYGGPFSLGLGTVGLTGISPGICYSESKDVAVTPTGGGFPTRYYVPLNRVKVALANAARMFASNADLVCDCGVCGAKMPARRARRGPRPDVAEAIEEMAAAEAKRHLMIVRAREARETTRLSPSALAARLESDARTAAERSTQVFGIPHAHLVVWARVYSRLG